MATFRLLQVERIDEVIIVRFVNTDVMDSAHAQQLTQELFEVITPGVRMVLNFSDVKYLSSMALSTLINLHKRVKSAGGILKLSNVSDPLCDVLEITNLHKILEVYPSEPAAVAAF